MVVKCNPLVILLYKLTLADHRDASMVSSWLKGISNVCFFSDLEEDIHSDRRGLSKTAQP